MEIRKSINNEIVFTMKDISKKLEIQKYHIKNWVREFDLKPSHIENKKWYFNKEQLLPFLTYLIYKEKLTSLKKEMKQWINKEIQE